MTIAHDTLISRGHGLLEAEIDGELVGLHIDNGTSYGFNATATRVWALIESPRAFGDIVSALGAEFDVDADQCAREVSDLLEDLASDGLVLLAPRPAATT